MQLLYITILSLIIGPLTVSAALLRVTFNNGVEPSISPCTAMDNMAIDRVLDYGRRQLTMSNETVTRGLGFLDKCKAACVAVKSCRVSNCFGYDGTAGGKRNIRSLQLPTTGCTTQINNINTKLNVLSVSSTCKNYIQSSTRKVECLDETMYGAITGAKLWTTSGVQTGRDLPATGLTTCISQNITIEALTNGCVSMVSFNMKGPGMYFDLGMTSSSPYVMFDQDDNNKFYGTKLPSIGSYTVTIQPDYYSNKAKKFTFKVTDC